MKIVNLMIVVCGIACISCMILALCYRLFTDNDTNAIWFGILGCFDGIAFISLLITYYEENR